jgi:hypothetical protein
LFDENECKDENENENESSENAVAEKVKQRHRIVNVTLHLASIRVYELDISFGIELVVSPP